jgi:predicted nucleotidyltransferase
MQMDRRELLKNIVEKIKENYQPQKIILFGSYAWGKPTKDSDIDLFIIKDCTEKHRQRALKVRRIITEENAFVGIDILVYTPKEVEERLKIGDSFIKKIMTKGVLLYG